MGTKRRPAGREALCCGLRPIVRIHPEPFLKPPFSFRSSMQTYNLGCTTQPDLITSHSSPLAMSFFNALNDPQSAHRPRRRALHAVLVMLLATTGFAALSLWPVTSDAGDNDHELARQALRQGQVLPLRTVLDQVEQQYQGQVIKVEFDREDGRFVYEIRLLQSDGKVVKLEIDASNGSLISMKRKK